MEYELDKALAAIAAEAQAVLKVDRLPVIEVAPPKFGADFAMPCFAFAQQLGKSPQDIAQQLTQTLHHPAIAKAQAVGGFVNIWLSDTVVGEALAHIDGAFGQHTTHSGKQIVIEHTDPNPFKEFHIGHAYSNTIGEALGRLLQAAGAQVHQVSYHADVGKHIAMAIWGIQQLLGRPETDWFDTEAAGDLTLTDVAQTKRLAFLGAAYAEGASAYKTDEATRAAIDSINQHLYAHDEQDIDELYEVGRAWSFAYFEGIYQQLQTSFEKNYFESEVAPKGLEIVRQYVGSVFWQSEGAIVYNGEQDGLHTRVFINSQGLPTYEAKDLALMYMKAEDYNFDQSIVVTANEIDEYYKVVVAAMRHIDPSLADKMVHLSHGVLKLTSGKMSSRTGQVVRAVDVLQAIRDSIAATYDTAEIDAIKLGALKYAFLKQRISGDVVFDIKEATALDGNTGPYLQYAHARGQSILAKLGQVNTVIIRDLTEDEHRLAIKLLAYPMATAKATTELAPHYICTYLYELTQQFNRFYENNRVVGDERQAQRAQLVQAYCRVLASGLQLLNIPAPQHL